MSPFAPRLRGASGALVAVVTALGFVFAACGGGTDTEGLRQDADELIRGVDDLLRGSDGVDNAPPLPVDRLDDVAVLARRLGSAPRGARDTERVQQLRDLQTGLERAQGVATAVAGARDDTRRRAGEAIRDAARDTARDALVQEAETFGAATIRDRVCARLRATVLDQPPADEPQPDDLAAAAITHMVGRSVPGGISAAADWQAWGAAILDHVAQIHDTLAADADATLLATAAGTRTRGVETYVRHCADG